MPFAAQGDPSPDLIRKTSDLSVRRQCELLGVTRSKVYYTPKSPDEEAIERKERIMGLIDYWHTENPRVNPKICVNSNEAVQNANRLRESGQRSHPMSACVHHSMPDGRSQGRREAPFIAAPAGRADP
jgi:hypothetical protein